MPETKIRIVTAGSLFDGHDAAINVIRRLLQSNGAEVIHLGHNRSAFEIVTAAIEEDVQAVAITSYQGGHLEFFKYIKDLLAENGAGHIRIFGGGGGTILPHEAEELHQYGISRIYSPDDGRRMGLEGMILDLLEQCRNPITRNSYTEKKVLNKNFNVLEIATAITAIENNSEVQAVATPLTSGIPVLGITGSGGAGKSSITDELVRRFLVAFADINIAVLAVDPSRKSTGGALLGDRIRMNAVSGNRTYMRSMATRTDNLAVSNYIQQAINVCRQHPFQLIIVETAGTGQNDTSITDLADVSLYVMTPEYGAATQLEKINMLDYADVICINKFDKPGAHDALAAVKKQYKRNHNLFTTANDEHLPVTGAIASKFNDKGVNTLFAHIVQLLQNKCGQEWKTSVSLTTPSIPFVFTDSGHALQEIVKTIRNYNQQANQQAQTASMLYRIQGALQVLPDAPPSLIQHATDLRDQLTAENQQRLEQWEQLLQQYSNEQLNYQVRSTTLSLPLTYTTLSGTRLPKIAVPVLSDWGDRLKWLLQENYPGNFPFTAGTFPLKRDNEDPTRMFAGEGCPERTNRRFHYLSTGQPANRLSTAFDSVTLYGEDPDHRPDIYGKTGNSGVSIATVTDMKKLFSGFNLCSPNTSVSLTINGPAPVILAFFFNAAIDQQCELWITQQPEAVQEHYRQLIQKTLQKYPVLSQPTYNNPSMPGQLPTGNNGLGLSLLGISGSDILPEDIYLQCRQLALQQIRGTVQADILKEDQAQNTCIFSTEFALKLMGDVQQYFIENNIKNFYSISVSGYHIAEAGANPITQLAFTLANGFTYVEYFLSCGMNIDSFAPNLSFFFSNGMDAEYAVIGRVARRIWAKALKYKYNANERSLKLKYHIQTSGRSLHAQEIDFNDIRTTLQALTAIYDNCNSLHTNAYDEAITTPTEESVRRAMAIQLIINKEMGIARTENLLQGSYIIEQLTDLVEEAVLSEFERIAVRGGVLNAMERMYQRNKIQEESMEYEMQKHSGQLPIIGVNSFLNQAGSPTILPQEVIRSDAEEKEQQINNLNAFKTANTPNAEYWLQQVKNAAAGNNNVFTTLMEAVKYCSLGQITHALYQIGGQYRRNM